MATEGVPAVSSRAAVDEDAERIVSVTIELNGETRSATVHSDRLLIDFLRTDLGATGTKLGCGVGVCGACSVLIDDRLTSSCIVLAATINGATVTTVEGLAAPDGTLTPLQDAFITEGGFQCGICTPGQLVAATALLADDPDPSERSIREWLTGNLCRCTGYASIVRAVQVAGAAPPTTG